MSDLNFETLARTTSLFQSCLGKIVPMMNLSRTELVQESLDFRVRYVTYSVSVTVTRLLRMYVLWQDTRGNYVCLGAGIHHA